MAVAFDAVDAAHGSVGGVTSFNRTDLSIGSGSNRAVISMLCWSAAVSAVTATWDSGGTNKNMPQVILGTNVAATRAAGIYAAVAPVSGAKLQAYSWTTAADVYSIALSFTGVDQTGGATSFPHSGSATGTSTSASITITTASGNWTVDTGVDNSSGVPGSPFSQTNLYTDTAATQNGWASRATAVSSGTSNVHSTTLAPSDTWLEVGSDIQAFGAAATDTTEWRGQYPPPRRIMAPNVAYSPIQ